MPIEETGRANGKVNHLRIAARAGQPGFVCVGSYDAAIEVSAARLDQAAGGVFRLDMDARGSVKSLHDIPGKARPKGGDHLPDQTGARGERRTSRPKRSPILAMWR